MRSNMAILTIFALMVLVPTASIADDSANYLTHKTAATPQKRTEGQLKNSEARAVIEKYWAATMKKCGSEYYYWHSEFDGDGAIHKVLIEVKPLRKEEIQAWVPNSSAKLNGFTWLGEASRQFDAIRAHPYDYTDISNVPWQIEPNITKNQWTDWAEIRLLTRDDYPLYVAEFFKKSGTWYIGDEDEAQSIDELVAAAKTEALRCSDIPK